MPVDPSLVSVHEHTDPGFKPLVDYGAWRVAVLNFCDELRPENLDRMQRHDATDEVFVLLEGRCLLFIGEGSADCGTVGVVEMVPGKLYNVRRGTWHTHTLDPDASVLVVENNDTTVDNSPFCDLTDDARAWIVAETERRWGADAFPAP